MEATMVYVVTRWGVYCHGVNGVYSTLFEATTAADECAAQDFDSHHEYVVEGIEIGAQTKPYYEDQRERLYSVRKEKPRST